MEEKRNAYKILVKTWREETTLKT